MPLLVSIFLSDVLPIFIVAGVGFVLARVLKADVRTLSRVTFNALSPCLIFHLLVTSNIGAADFARMMTMASVACLGIGLVARAAAMPFRLDRPTLAAFLVVVMFSNAGNYGLPVVLFAFGREALAHASIYFVTNAVLMYTVGVFLASAGRQPVTHALRGVLRVPTFYGALAAGVALWLGLHVPAPLMRPIELMSGAALPCMLLVLGMQLERGAWPNRPGLVLLATTLSLVVTPLIRVGRRSPAGTVRRGAAGGDPPVRDARRGAVDDHRAGVRHRARLRHRVRDGVHAPQPTDGHGADRALTVRAKVLEVPEVHTGASAGSAERASAGSAERADGAVPRGYVTWRRHAPSRLLTIFTRSLTAVGPLTSLQRLGARKTF